MLDDIIELLKKERYSRVNTMFNNIEISPGVANKIIEVLTDENINNLDPNVLHTILKKHSETIIQNGYQDKIYKIINFLRLGNKNMLYRILNIFKRKPWLNLIHFLKMINYKNLNLKDQVTILNFVKEQYKLDDLTSILDWMYASINKPKDEYISQEHYEYCKNPSENLTLKYPEIEQIFNVNFDVFTIDFKPQYLDTLLKQQQRKFLKNHSISLKYLTNSNYNDVKLSFQNDYLNLSKNVKWIDACGDYIENLSVKDKLTILGYTSNGYEYTNNFLLKNYKELNVNIQLMIHYSKNTKRYFALYIHILEIIVELNDSKYSTYQEYNWARKEFKLEFAKESERYIHIVNNIDKIPINIFYLAIQQYIKDLERICRNAPKLIHDLYVYRGETNEYISDEKEFLTPTFQSTSISPSVALDFTPWSGVFKRIKIPKGTNCIYIQTLSHFTEIEVLLPVNTKLRIDKISDVKYIDQNWDSIKHKLCSPMRPFKYYEMSVI